MYTHGMFVAEKFTICLMAIIISIGTSAIICDATESSAKVHESAFRSYVSKFTIDGYIKNESALRLPSPSRTTKLKTLFQVELNGLMMDWLDINILSWAMYDAAYDLDEQYPEEVQEEYRSNLTAEEAYEQTFREIYVDIFLKTMDFRIGKQQIVWGEAIGLRITDIINPQDYREFILGDYIDSRIPVWMAKFNYYIGQWTVEGLWIPFFEPERLAIYGSEWEWTFNKILPPQGVGVKLNTPEEPSTDLENSEYGGRISGILAEWNVALSYLYSWDDSPSRHLDFDPQALTINVDQIFHRMIVYGFTFANSYGRFVPRGEVSYKMGKHFNTSDVHDEDGLKKKDFLYYMAGTDYSISDYLFNFQIIQKVIMDYEDSIYEDYIQTTYSFQVQAKFLNETLKPDILVIYGENENDWMIRPKIAYGISDQFTIAIGVDIFSGPSKSFFGQFNSNDRAYIKFKYSF